MHPSIQQGWRAGVQSTEHGAGATSEHGAGPHPSCQAISKFTNKQVGIGPGATALRMGTFAKASASSNGSKSIS